MKRNRQASGESLPVDGGANVPSRRAPAARIAIDVRNAEPLDVDAFAGRLVALLLEAEGIDVAAEQPARRIGA